MSIRVGKLGIVRLTGKDLDHLRLLRWTLSKGICQQCGRMTLLNPRFDGDPEAYDMAHIRNRRMYGDTLENTMTLCHADHMKSHNAGGKPCPTKPGREE